MDMREGLKAASMPSAHQVGTGTTCAPSGSQQHDWVCSPPRRPHTLSHLQGSQLVGIVGSQAHPLSALVLPEGRQQARCLSVLQRQAGGTGASHESRDAGTAMMHGRKSREP